MSERLKAHSRGVLTRARPKSAPGEVTIIERLLEQLRSTTHMQVVAVGALLPAYGIVSKILRLA